MNHKLEQFKLKMANARKSSKIVLSPDEAFTVVDELKRLELMITELNAQLLEKQRIIDTTVKMPEQLTVRLRGNKFKTDI